MIGNSPNKNVGIACNLSKVRWRLQEACRSSGREEHSVDLMAVTKTQPVETVEEAFRHGLSLYGENRVPEGVEKIKRFKAEAKWELIGQLQTNKARQAIAHFDRIQSVDRRKLIATLARLVEEGVAVCKPFPILIQVNAGEDPAKSGCRIEEAEELLIMALETNYLRIDGLMTIAPLDDSPDVASRCFANLRKLRDRLREKVGLPLEVLSMGMTGDLEQAIAEGSTLVRVGSALFGERNYT